MRTAIGATAVNIAKPTNLGMPMIHAFLDNIRYITIELNGLTLYDMSAGVISCGSCHRWSKKCRSRSASATGTSN